MANDQHAFLAAVVLTNDLVDETEAGGWRVSRKLPPLKPGWVRRRMVRLRSIAPAWT